MHDLDAILARNAGLLTHPPTMTPTNHFPDGPLMGNGDITVVNAGPSDLQTFHIGKGDFWTDGVGYEMTNEEYDNYVVSPITIGSVRLWMRDFELATYRQHIDIANAEVRGRFEGQEAVVTTRTWCAATKNLFFIELAVEQAPGPIGFHVRTEAKNNDDPDHASLPTGSGSERDGIIWSTRETWDRGRWVSRAAIALRVMEQAPARTWTGASRHANGAILLRRGQRVTIAVSVAGGKNATTHREDAIAQLRSLTPHAIEQLRDSHQQWWKSYWEKSSIDLGDGPVEKFWYGSLYAMACCSRPGHTCPGMFGFSTHDHPRWSGDYHLNYNGEHPFAGLFVANRGELAEPYFDAMNDFVDEGRRRAREDLTPPMPGVYYPIGLGPWGVVAQDSYMSQKCAAAYAAWPFIEHFRHYRDLALTRRKIYPFCRDVGEFWQAYLTKTDGRYQIIGSASHEHGGHDRNTVFDLPLVKNLFKGLLEMSAALSIDESMHVTWRDIVEHLAPYPTTVHEGVRVFKEADNCDHFTRSISLYNVMWPGGGDVSETVNPELAEVGRNTLRLIDKWAQGNSFSWIFPAAVRVNYPGIHQMLVERLEAEDGLRPNLTYAQAYGGIETIGGIATVNEMLLQSFDGTIRLFPVWPREKDASFESLAARGAHRVSASLVGQQITSVRITSLAGEPVRFDSPWKRTRVRSGDRVVVEVEGRTIAFATDAGATYDLEPA